MHSIEDEAITRPARMRVSALRAVAKLLLAMALICVGAGQARAQCDDLNPNCQSAAGVSFNCSSAGDCWDSLVKLLEGVKDFGEVIWDGLVSVGEEIASWFEGDPGPSPSEAALEDAKRALDEFSKDVSERAQATGRAEGVEAIETARQAKPDISTTTAGRSRSGELAAPRIQGELMPPSDGSKVRSLGADLGTSEADTDPVSLRNGEFYLTALDHEFVGAEPELRMVRTYRSRVEFAGDLGPGWDHSLNPRLFFNTGTTGCGNEIVVSLGDLNPIVLRPSAAGADVYEGRFGTSALKLRKRSGDSCRWKLTLPNAYQYCFDRRGLATQLTAPNDGYLQFIWEDEGSSPRIAQVRRYLKGQEEPTHRLRFDYSNQRLQATWLQGLDGSRVDYDYDADLRLERVRDGTGQRARYVYRQRIVEADARLALAEANAYCNDYCSIGSECGGASYCEAAAALRVARCEATCECEDTCNAAFDVLKEEDIQRCIDSQEPTSSYDVAQICRNAGNELTEAFRASYVEQCLGTCEVACSDCDEAKFVALCKETNECKTECLWLIDEPEKYVFGVPSDLNHNLVQVLDGAGREIVHNTYGEDPSQADFDAVIEQRVGERAAPIEFEYVDFTWSEEHALANEHAPIEAPACKPTTQVLDEAFQEARRTIVPAPWPRDILTGEVITPPTPFPILSPTPTLSELLESVEPYRELIELWEVGPDQLYPRFAPAGVGPRQLITSSGVVRLTPVLADDVALTPGIFRDDVELVRADLALPLGLDERSVALSSSKALYLGDRSSVDGVVVNAGEAESRIGRDSFVQTLLSASEWTQLADGASFTTALVRGQVQKGADVSGSLATSELKLEPITWRFPTALPQTASRVEVGRGQTVTLEPGGYDEVVVREAGQLALQDGQYSVRSLTLESGAALAAPPAGSSRLTVSQTFMWRGEAKDRAEESARRLLWVYSGHDELHLDSAFSGTLVAPNAKVNLKRGQHYGAVFAESVELHADARLRHVPFGWDRIDEQRVAVRTYQLVDAPALAEQSGLALGELVASLVGVSVGDLVATVRTPRGLVPHARITGIGQLDGGTCDRSLELTRASDGRVHMSPPNACSGTHLRLTALASFTSERLDVWERFLPAPTATLVVEDPENGIYRFASQRGMPLSAEAWQEAIQRMLSAGMVLAPRDGSTTLLRPIDARVTGNPDRLAGIFAKLARRSGREVERSVWSLVEDLARKLRQGLVATFDDAIRRFTESLSERVAVHSWGGDSGAVPGSELDPKCGADPPLLRWRERGPARWATIVKRPNDTSLISYYDARGDNVRVIDVETQRVVDMSYDHNHHLAARVEHLSGEREPIGPPLCRQFDERGLIVEQSIIATDMSDSITRCASYQPGRPNLKAVTVPNSAQTLALDIDYDEQGNPRVVRNALGEETVYEFDLSTNRLRSVTFPTGSVTRFRDYDSTTGWPRRAIEDALGEEKITDYEFDAYGHLTHVARHGWGPDETWDWTDRVRLDSHLLTHEGGSSLERFNYYDNGRLRSFETPLARRTWGYTPEGLLAFSRVESSSDSELAAGRCATYDIQGLATRLVNEHGLLVHVERERSRNRTIEQYTIDHNDGGNGSCPTPNSSAARVEEGLQSEVHRDALGRVVQIVSSDSVTERLTYDELGRLEQRIDASGARTLLRYDDRSRLAATIVATAEVLLPQRVDPESADESSVASATFYEYNDAGELVGEQVYARLASEGPLELVADTAWERRTAERILIRHQQAAAGALRTTFSFDALGRLIAEEDNAGNFRSVAYPAAGVAEVSTLGPGGAALSVAVSMTQLGAPLEVQDASGRRTAAWEYDQYGRLVWLENESGSGSWLVYNGLSQRTQVISLASRDSSEALEQTTFVYDDRAMLEAVQSFDGTIVRYGYDTLGRTVSENYYTGSEPIRTSYVAATLKPEHIAFPSGRQWSYDYDDPRGLLTSITAEHAEGIGTAGPRSLTRSFVVDGLGNVSRATQGEAAVRLDHDGLGRVIRETGLVTSRVEYGLGGLPRSITHGGQSAVFDYTLDGRTASISVGDQVLYTAQYLGAGAATAFTYGNGLNWVRSFDPRGRLLDEGDELLSLNYRYGPDGRTRLFSAKMAVAIEPEQAPLPARSQLLSLDDIGRVTGELTTNWLPEAGAQELFDNAAFEAQLANASASQSLAYDSSGNLAELASSGAVWQPRANELNQYRNARDGSPILYDEDGRLIVNETQQFFYDAFGQLARATTSEGSCDYDYDAFGRRVAEHCGSESTRFAHLGHSLVATSAAEGERVYFRATNSIAPTVAVDPAHPVDVEYYALSKDGSVRAIYGPRGNVEAYYQYGISGETEIFGGASTTNRFAYHGHIFDPATGLYQMRARYYSPELARFTSPDPIGVAGGSNLYRFAANRPNDYTDPFGLSPSANPMTDGAAPCASYPCGEAATGLTRVPFGPRGAQPGTIFVFVEGRDQLVPADAFNQVAQGRQRFIYDPHAELSSSVDYSRLSAAQYTQAMNNALQSALEAAGTCTGPACGFAKPGQQVTNPNPDLADTIALGTGLIAGEGPQEGGGARGAPGGLGVGDGNLPAQLAMAAMNVGRPGAARGVTALSKVGQAKIPSSWGRAAAAKKGVGVRWTDPTNKGNGVRIDAGNPANSQITQQVDHVIVRHNGRVIGRNGKPITGSIADNAAEAHIPLSEWQTWSKWFAP